MAFNPPSKTTGRGKVPGPDNIEAPKPNENVYEFERRLQAHNQNLGSRYAPNRIEPQAFVRNRLATPMTDEGRFLRKQWLQDQKLAPDEPRRVPALRPLNIFRRFYRYPWDTMEVAMKGVMNPNAAVFIRQVVPKLGMIYVAAVLGYYWLKYHPHSWQAVKGPHFFTSRLPQFQGDVLSERKPDPIVFATKGFDKRTVFLNNK